MNLIQFDGCTVAVIAPEDLEELESTIERLRDENERLHDKLREAQRRDLRRDAERYRWLKGVHGLRLNRNPPMKWTREDGTTFFSEYYLAGNQTVYGVAPSMDETIDAAMALDIQHDPVLGSVFMCPCADCINRETAALRGEGE